MFDVSFASVASLEEVCDLFCVAPDRELQSSGFSEAFGWIEAGW
jgi:hypothetical protein